MKIIKIGILPPETKQETCFHCKTVFEYEPNDVRFYDRDGSDKYVGCPLCKRSISVI